MLALDGELTPSERGEVEIVVDAGRRMGWIGRRDEVRVRSAPQQVSVSVLGSGGAQARDYPRTDRWVFELLREMSQGIWRASAQRARQQGVGF
jgi:hypothetical protein